MRLRFSRTSPGRAGHELDDDAADRLETEADERATPWWSPTTTPSSLPSKRGTTRARQTLRRSRESADLPVHARGPCPARARTRAPIAAAFGPALWDAAG